MDLEAEIVALRLAKGLMDIYEGVVSRGGAAVRQDASMPESARRALAFLSAHCLMAGGEQQDLGASIHVVMEHASRPFRSWGLPAFAGDFRYADVALIDADNGVPTEDCRELARIGGGDEIAAMEELHHERLQAAIKDLSAKQRAQAYTEIREFCVRNPVAHEEDLHEAISRGGYVGAARTIMEFYRDIPQGTLFGGRAHRCAYCGSLLWPDADVSSYPVGRCRIRPCRLAHPSAKRGEVLEEPRRWRLATPAILAFWVGPGLDEVRVFDGLRARGRAVALYPFADAADIGVDNLKVGIDVKTYASPILLGGRLTQTIGRLSMFERRIVAVPDDKLRLNPRYLEQLRASYEGPALLEFLTVSDVIREFAP